MLWTVTSRDRTRAMPSARPFTAETRVGDAIAADADVVDRLVALSPIFAKLRNPVLRKMMARLVTFGDAAKVSGVPLDAILRAANGDAFSGKAAPRGPTAAAPPEAAPEWVASIDEDAAIRLDVRPILAAGDEPFAAIMRTAAKIPERGSLILDAPFDPVPLRRVLANKGFRAHAQELAPDHWRVCLQRAGETAPVAPPGEASVWREHGTAHIDVRGLEPPQPMLAVLRLIERDDVGDTVIVHHEREPMFLYPELAERGWSHAIVPGDPGEVRLRLTRDRP